MGRMSHRTTGGDRENYVIEACKDRIDPDGETAVDDGQMIARTSAGEDRWLEGPSRISLLRLAKMQDAER